VRRAEADVRRLDNAASWTEYASLLRARGEHLKAADAAHRAVERSPASVEARYELGLALLGAERWADAADALRSVVDEDRTFDSDSALFALSKAQHASGDFEAARASLEELAQRRARPEILYDLAALQGRLGDREPAVRTLQRIVDEAELVPAYLQSEVRPWVRKARPACASWEPESAPVRPDERRPGNYPRERWRGEPDRSPPCISPRWGRCLQTAPPEGEVWGVPR
jgi:tetratricopeptide (TPR) repeat protein